MIAFRCGPGMTAVTLRIKNALLSDKRNFIPRFGLLANGEKAARNGARRVPGMASEVKTVASGGQKP